MSRHGKKYRNVAKEAPKSVLELEQAIAFLKNHRIAKFDETMELAFRLGLDPKRSEQTVRGSVNLPHGTGKRVRVVVFASGQAAEEARAAGADYVGMEDLIEKIQKGWTDFDVAIATTDAMKEVRKLGKVLGPRGLMPNPKTGTITDDTAQAVKVSKAGKVDFRMDRGGNVHVPFGKISFDVPQLVENARTVIAAIKAEKPAGLKGMYIRRCTVSSTMGVGLRVNAGD